VSDIESAQAATDGESTKADERTGRRQRPEFKDLQSKRIDFGPIPRPYLKNPTLSANLKPSISLGFTLPCPRDEFSQPSRDFSRASRVLKRSEIIGSVVSDISA
jgi:hypothetical protein